MRIRVPYGRTFLQAEISDHWHVDEIAPPWVDAAPDPLACVKQALAEPLGGVCLPEFNGAQRVAIAVNDKTRPVPHAHLLPPLLDALESAGFPRPAITFIVATGTHPPMAPGEFSAILPGQVLERTRVISHDAGDASTLVFLGETSRGTPVWTNREFVEAELRIVVGNIEPHQFVGFSGGVKTAAIGLGGFDTINRNHSLMTHPASQLGSYGTNPARQDVEEIGAIAGVHFALNAVLNHHKEIVYVLAGAPQAVMQAGVPLARQVGQVRVSGEYDLIISSPGGHPKDINLYQAQKGLAHAALVTRRGGAVILCAACHEGTGSDHYEDWMQDKHSYQQVMARFQEEGFRIGPHKAYQIARDAARVHLHFCSNMNPDLAQRLLLHPAPTLQSALDGVLASLPDGARIGVMPNAASTIPFTGQGGG